jgi:hypothetical protein
MGGDEDDRETQGQLASNETGVMINNFREKANFIWQVADDTLCMRGSSKAHETITARA